ncbi:Sec14p-like phosphatidylinositol transfer family protein [Striga asiatica]|uniref:Sec14p-like phosphatidylinositol transfer family protein n=1 Tax=Striga asiatica TaxID=4170 RepID=A0A5A7R6C1_STRAF|nr:Sec14p-like phosphatidylinositol transfer family protein [Striga asiatica]
MLNKHNSKPTKPHDLSMSGKIPLEIGTRGTIGSLLKLEIEFFKGLELERVESCMDFERRSQEMATQRRHSWPSLRFPIFYWKRKKKRRKSGNRASMCSMVEIEDRQELDEIPGFGYLNLKAESMRYDVE